MRFGTLQVSTLTLFMSITGGLSWVEATDLLVNIGWLWVYAFCSFVSPLDIDLNNHEGITLAS